MRVTKRARGVAMGLMVLSLAGVVAARDATHKGTITAVDKTRIQVKLADEAGKPQAKGEWFALTANTKVTRGTAAVPLARAKFKTGERATVLVNTGDEAGVEWFCQMHPDKPRTAAGDCPICGMTLKERTRPAKAAEVRLEAP